MNSSLFFSKMRVISIKPAYGPSSGNTLINLLGTGFTNSNKQKIKFKVKTKDEDN